VREMEARCPFWKECGGAIAHDYWAKQFFTSYGDPQRDYIGAVCSNEDNYPKCGHFQIRKEGKVRC